MHDNRTKTAVSRQIKGMGADLFEVGIRDAAKGMLNREWTPEQVLHALPWLQSQNVDGSDIYIRPARSRDSQLILIDDLTLGALAKLRASDYAPAVIVQTSPGNFQAWVKLDEPTPAALRLEIARFLMREFGGDPNSADSAHYGRLAGFTNRKPEHIDAAGRSPWVLLDSYNGKTAPASPALVAKAAHEVDRVRAQAREMAEHVKASAKALPVVTLGSGQVFDLSDWYRTLWHDLKASFGQQFDASRADWMAAVAMFNKGYDFASVAAAISEHSPGIIERKGCNVADYVTRTAGKAEVWHDLKQQGAEYAAVQDQLLALAQQRARAGDNSELSKSY